MSWPFSLLEGCETRTFESYLSGECSSGNKDESEGDRSISEQNDLDPFFLEHDKGNSMDGVSKEHSNFGLVGLELLRHEPMYELNSIFNKSIDTNNCGSNLASKQSFVDNPSRSKKIHCQNAERKRKRAEMQGSREKSAYFTKSLMRSNSEPVSNTQSWTVALEEGELHCGERKRLNQLSVEELWSIWKNEQQNKTNYSDDLSVHSSREGASLANTSKSSLGNSSPRMKAHEHPVNIKNDSTLEVTKKVIHFTSTPNRPSAISTKEERKQCLNEMKHHAFLGNLSYMGHGITFSSSMEENSNALAFDLDGDESGVDATESDFLWKHLRLD